MSGYHRKDELRGERTQRTVCYLELDRGLKAWHQGYLSSCVNLHPHFEFNASRGTHIYTFCFQPLCSSSNLLTSAFLEKERLRGKQQTAAPRDSWHHHLAAGTANLGPVTGPTLRKKPPAVWHRWDTTELAHYFSSLIHVDLVILLQQKGNETIIHS